MGKGIVYDSGGLSIKTPTAGMCGMKMVRYVKLHRVYTTVVYYSACTIMNLITYILLVHV